MNVTVGRVWLILVFVMHLPLCAQMTLRVESIDGIALQHASVGYPFRLAVTVEGQHAGMQWPEIDGLELFEVVGRQTHMQIAGSVKTVTYVYQVLAREPGLHILGPARSAHEASETVTLEVKDVPSSHASSSSAESVMVRLRINKQHVVVGEKIHCTLTFLSRDESNRFVDFIAPKFQGWQVLKEYDLIASIQEIDGVKHYAVTCAWDLCAQSDGVFTVPACLVFYKALLPHRRRYTDKRTYSNALKLIVDPVPAHDAPVNGIGEFDRVHATITPAVAKQGEAMVLTLAVEGDGAFENATLPTLQGLPDSCRHYFSKQYVSSTDAGSVLYCFDYIVQALEQGEWAIPEQLFTYFDVRARAYKTLQSAPLFINVLKDAQYAASLENQEKVSVDEYEEEGRELDQELDTAAVILPLHEDGPWYHRQQKFIPWWLFGVILALSLGWLCIGAVMYALRCLMAPHQERMHYSRAFVQARIALQQAHKKSDHKKVYGIFIQLFAVRSGCKASVLSHEKIDALLKRAGMVQEDRMQWYNFFTTAAECVFYPRAHRGTVALFDDAYAWLARLEKIL